MTSLNFNSILFPDFNEKDLTANQPAFFYDLNIDQIINTIVKYKQEFDLLPFYYTIPKDKKLISYRQAIVKDLENPALFNYLKSFENNFREMRKIRQQMEKSYYENQKKRLLLDSVIIYCNAVKSLLNNLQNKKIQSQGFISFIAYLKALTQSAGFKNLSDEADKLLRDLEGILFSIKIKNLKVSIYGYEHAENLSSEIENLFNRFKQSAAENKYSYKISGSAEMNHVENKILNGAAILFPEIFNRLDAFCLSNNNFADDKLLKFDREIQFYLSYLEYADVFQSCGLKFCYPVITDDTKAIRSYETFNLALAGNLIQEGKDVTVNDFFLNEPERVLIVTGPNQSGKTTFAKTFAQIHYLGALGLPVPGSKSQLFLFDTLFTHFESEEKIENIRSKLEDDLFRIHQILSQATSRSMIILNEIFTTTTFDDSLELSRKILEMISNKDIICVWVTFLVELTDYIHKTVSYTGEIKNDEYDTRTYKIFKKPADGLAYAYLIAEKHNLTYEKLMRRIKK
jgi:DNA mismatch repair ATPase MutS